MNINDFDFKLPEEQIARRPLAKRDAARLLNVAAGNQHQSFADIVSVFNPGDVLVLNDSKVLPARFYGRKETGAKIELLFERAEDDYTGLFHIKGKKKLKEGDLILAHDNAFKVLKINDLVSLKSAQPIFDFLHEYGELALPPYLNRAADSTDSDEYQTVYAAEEGSVAAPTAGLHFTDELLDAVRAKGVTVCMVTLHVGAGTFQSLRHENVTDNILHHERYWVPDATRRAIAKAKAEGRRVIACGTTSVRTLESFAASDNTSGSTNLFIYPGYKFALVDAMITNFHLPKSSLMLLVSAFAGIDKIRAAYDTAITEGYRFFSYGDAMFLEREC